MVDAASRGVVGIIVQRAPVDGMASESGGAMACGFATNGKRNFVAYHSLVVLGDDSADLRAGA